MAFMVPARLVTLVVCPSCHGALRINADFTSLRCTKCDRRYPVEDEIPILLVERSGFDGNKAK
jgi:hypothetical protein